MWRTQPSEINQSIHSIDEYEPRLAVIPNDNSISDFENATELSKTTITTSVLNLDDPIVFDRSSNQQSIHTGEIISDNLSLFDEFDDISVKSINEFNNNIFSLKNQSDVEAAILNLMKNRCLWTSDEIKNQLKSDFLIPDSVTNISSLHITEKKLEEWIGSSLSQMGSNSLNIKGLVTSFSNGSHIITELGVSRIKLEKKNDFPSSQKLGFPDKLEVGRKPLRKGKRERASEKAFQATLDVARRALIDLREQEIKPSYPDTDPARGLLRKSMIDEILQKKPKNEEEFRGRIRQELREATDGEQIKRYIGKVFEIINNLN